MLKAAVDDGSTERVTWAITAAARRLPMSTTCLFDALYGVVKAHTSELPDRYRSLVAPAASVGESNPPLMKIPTRFVRRRSPTAASSNTPNLSM
jgi:hypothetical protein